MSQKKAAAPGKPAKEELKDIPQQDNSENDQESEKEKKDIEQNKFQSLPLREYYDHAVTSLLLEGLRELGRQRFLNLKNFFIYNRFFLFC